MTPPPTACPDAGKLVAWLDDALPADERERLASHLETCPRCARALEGVQARRMAVSGWLAAHDAPVPPRDAYDLSPRPRGARPAATVRRIDRSGRSRAGLRWALAASVVLAVAVAAGPARGWILDRLGLASPDAPSLAVSAGDRASTSFVPSGPELTLVFTTAAAGRTLSLKRGSAPRATLTAPRPDPEVLVGPDRLEIRGGDARGAYRLEVPPTVTSVRVRVPNAPDALFEVGEGERVVDIPPGSGQRRPDPPPPGSGAKQ